MRQTRLNQRPDQHAEAPRPPPAGAREASPFPDAMLLQSTIGNAAVGNLIQARERALDEQPTPVDAFTQGLIARQAGGGEVIQDSPAGARVHYGPESDMLTRLLGATGLTQGRDVFLRSDRDPASAAGRTTLTHELTHVAQGSVGAGAVMREPAEPMDAQKAGASVIVAKITWTVTTSSRARARSRAIPAR